MFDWFGNNNNNVKVESKTLEGVKTLDIDVVHNMSLTNILLIAILIIKTIELYYMYKENIKHKITKREAMRQKVLSLSTENL